MKKRLQGLIAGILIGIILTSGVSFASQITKTAELVYNNIKIFIDGNEIVPKDANGNLVEPFIMDGTTYLPVRAVGNAFGKNVQWDGETQSVYIGNYVPKPSGSFSENELLNNFDITTYTWTKYSTYYLALVIKNNTDINCDLTADVLFKDASGNLVGADKNSTDAFEAHQETCLIFSNDIEFSDFSYELNVSKVKYYDCITSSLTTQITQLPEKAIISITNNGSKPAKYVEYNILFFKNGKVINRDWGYVTDDDDEIKIGCTETDESTCYEKYDDIKIFLSAYAEK